MPSQKPYTHWIPERQIMLFRSLSEQTGVTVSELMRKTFDYCLQDKIMNELIPSMSGTIKVGK